MGSQNNAYGVFELEFILRKKAADRFEWRLCQQFASNIARGEDADSDVWGSRGNQAEVNRLMANGNSGKHEDVAGSCYHFGLNFANDVAQGRGVQAFATNIACRRAKKRQLMPPLEIRWL
jgi:hypothetical protein